MVDHLSQTKRKSGSGVDGSTEDVEAKAPQEGMKDSERTNGSNSR